MLNKRIAVAAFAKTIGSFPVKTRLSNSIGKDKAEIFYWHCIESIRQLLRQLEEINFKAYWALGGQECLEKDCWQDFSTLWTGEGDLGQRLHQVYATLRLQQEGVVLMGTDSPQLGVKHLLTALEKLQENPDSCVIGPCFDGGFYLFAAQIPMDKSILTNIEYSQPTTLKKLLENLKEQGISTELLPVETDVDRREDFPILLKELEQQSQLLPAQENLLSWLKREFPSH